jgi:hypothetical protein
MWGKIKDMESQLRNRIGIKRCRSITLRRTIGTSNVDNFKYIRYFKLWCTVNYYVEEPTKLQILHARSQLEGEH